MKEPEMALPKTSQNYVHVHSEMTFSRWFWSFDLEGSAAIDHRNIHCPVFSTNITCTRHGQLDCPPVISPDLCAHGMARLCRRVAQRSAQIHRSLQVHRWRCGQPHGDVRCQTTGCSDAAHSTGGPDLNPAKAPDLRGMKWDEHPLMALPHKSLLSEVRAEATNLTKKHGGKDPNNIGFHWWSRPSMNMPCISMLFLVGFNSWDILMRPHPNRGGFCAASNSIPKQYCVFYVVLIVLRFGSLIHIYRIWSRSFAMLLASI